jgi:diguanylate cyclase (GGDEF)-like protein/PAS domain S-box-containing protein
MSDEPHGLTAALDRYRSEVLVAVRPRGIVIAHSGGDVFGWAPGVAGPRMLADVFAAADVARVEAVMHGSLLNQRTTVPGSVLALRAGGVTPVTVDVLDASNDDLRSWVLRLHPAPTGPSFDLLDDAPGVDTSAATEVARRFETIAEAVPFAIMAGRREDRPDYENPAARELLWRTADDLRLHGWLAAVTDEDRDETAAALRRVRASGIAEVVEFRVSVTGRIRWLRGRLSSESSAGEHSAGWVAVFSDVTSERANADELARRATHDALTGLPNRSLFEDRLSITASRAVRNRASLAVLFLDLDDFKAVNDDHGHRIGDRVLRSVATRIGSVVRDADTAARLGGDEFVVIAEAVSADEAREIAGRIARTIREPMVFDEDLRVAVRPSIGIAWVAVAGEVGPTMLVDRADRAMYEAKRAGVDVHLDVLGAADADDPEDEPEHPETA